MCDRDLQFEIDLTRIKTNHIYTRAYMTTHKHNNDECFYYDSWRNNEVIAFGTLSSFRSHFHIVSRVVCVVCPFAGDEKLKTFIMPTYTNMTTHTNTSTHIHTIRINNHTQPHTYIMLWRIHVHVDTHAHTQRNVLALSLAHTEIHKHTSALVLHCGTHTHKQLHAQTHTYSHIYTHTYTHTSAH